MAAIRTDEQVLEAELSRAALSIPLCPFDRLGQRRRNLICIWVIAIGTLNFVSYTLMYAALGGDAHNGERRVLVQEDGSQQVEYFVRGHFIRNPEGRAAQVNRGLWIYSYIHSISLWLTSGAMIISMLVLARPHIIATMRGSLIGGRAFIAVLGTIVSLLTVGATLLFVWEFAVELSQ